MDKSFDKVNDVSEEEYYKGNAPKGKADNNYGNPDMPCKTCKFSGKQYNGKAITGRSNPAYMSGTCEKYETKPAGVFFKARKCPKYEAK